jgi:hypothetical protein
MSFSGGHRAAESSFIERIWWGESGNAGNAFVTTASTGGEIVVTMPPDRPPYVSIVGPETHPTTRTMPGEHRWLGITFAAGVFLDPLPMRFLVDGGQDLPAAGDGRFWLHGEAWDLPVESTADAFVARLIRDGTLVRDPVVADVLAGIPSGMTPRTEQRRFLDATGLTHSMIRQIQRANDAVHLLRQGAPIIRVVHDTGYADQAHLTRSLRRWTGQTPKAIRDDPAML